MAVALKAISELSQTKLSVAVFSGGQESTPSSGAEHEIDADKLRRLRGLLDTVEG